MAIRRPTKWTYEALAGSAAGYDSVKEWRTNEPSAYATASQQKLLSELTAHMHKRIVHGYWTEERILDSAKKFDQISKWSAAYPSAYGAARKKGLVQLATSHMTPIGNKKLRCVYIVKVVGSNLVYVGLTGDIKRRFRDHLKTKRFAELAEKYGTDKIKCDQVSPYIPAQDAQTLEGETVRDCISNGYKLLNKVKTGGLGGTDIRWTDDAILAEALKYSVLKEWRDNSPGSYSAAVKKRMVRKVSSHQKRLLEERWDKTAIMQNAIKFQHKIRWKEAFPGAVLAARRMGCYEKATAHMSPLSERDKWTKARIIEDAQKYKSKSQWHKKSSGAYEAALRNNLMETATKHMRNKKVHVWTDELLLIEKNKYADLQQWKQMAPNSFLAARKKGLFGLRPIKSKLMQTRRWSKSDVLKDAKKYHSRSAWKKNSGGAYSSAVRNGWYDEAVSHMTKLNPVGKWTNETVLAETLKYKTKSEWQAKSVGSYEAAKRLGCFAEAISHMVVQRKKWTQAEVIDAAKGFSSIKEWRAKHATSYAAAHRLGIINEASKHMVRINPIGVWLEKEAVLADAKKYLTRSEWHTKSAGAYTSAKRNGWFEEAVSHMIASNHR